jgi:predicted N-acetyltransferase YhbS
MSDAPVIHLVARADLYPYFGYARPAQGTVWGPGDLPKRRDFVLAHETDNLQTSETSCGGKSRPTQRPCANTPSAACAACG